MKVNEILNDAYRLLNTIESEHKREIDSLKSQLFLSTEAHKDLIDNYAIINREFVDLLDVSYPCVKCGKSITIDNIERFNPDFHTCGGDCGNCT